MIAVAAPNTTNIRNARIRPPQSADWHFRRTLRAVPLADALAEMIVTKQALGRSASSVDDYRRPAELFITWLESQGIPPTTDALEVTVARRFLAWLATTYRAQNPYTGVARRISVNTLRMRGIALKAFAKWVAREYDGADGLAKLELPTKERHEIVPFSDGQVVQLLDLAAQHRVRWVAARNVGLFLLLLDSACRISEACNLTLDRLDLDYKPDVGRALLTVTKGKRDRWVYFGHRTVEALRDYLEMAKPHRTESCDRVFVAGPSAPGRPRGPIDRSDVYKLMRRLGHKAGISEVVRCSPHTWRHTGATGYARRGAGAFALQQLLGHTTIDQTLTYIRMANGDAEKLVRTSSPVEAMGSVVDAIQVEPRGR